MRYVKLFITFLPLFLFILVSGKTSAQTADFVAFSINNRYAFFRVINPASENQPIKYLIFDMKKERVIQEYKTKRNMEYWNRYFGNLSKVIGIKRKQYKGYSVQMQCKETVYKGEEKPGMGTDRVFDWNKAPAVFHRKKCTLYLVYNKYGYFKKTPLFEHSLSSYTAMPTVTHYVWWAPHLKAVAVVLIWNVKSYGHSNFHYKVFALSW